MMTPDTLHRLAGRFRHFARAECPEEPLYAALSTQVADTPVLLDLLADAPDAQQRPNLWLAAVHDVLLSGVSHPLAAYFPSVGGTRAPDAALGAVVLDFAAAHQTVLRALMAKRSTQTNEVGRCAVLWPALHTIAARMGQADLALLDFGCSAGLNLGVDLYRYRAADALPGRPLIEPRWVGDRRPPASPTPHLVQRLGIDPAPVRLDDDAERRWLRACLWPSDRLRAERFDQAVALARQHRWPVRQVHDCTAYLHEWLDQVPAGVQPVLFNSWVLAYFDAPALQRHLDTVTTLVQSRGLVWLSAEDQALVLGDVVAPPVPSGVTACTHWTVCRPGPGRAQFELLARSHAHGRWLEWLDTR